MESIKLQSFVPKGHRVLLRPKGKVQITEGIIQVAETTAGIPLVGEIVEIGDGHVADETGVHVPVRLEKGQIVLYPEQQGVEFFVNGEELLLLDEGYVLGVV